MQFPFRRIRDRFKRRPLLSGEVRSRRGGHKLNIGAFLSQVVVGGPCYVLMRLEVQPNELILEVIEGLGLSSTVGDP